MGVVKTKVHGGLIVKVGVKKAVCRADRMAQQLKVFAASLMT